jgi:hypothetical protein
MAWVVETDVTRALATALMFSQWSSSTSAATEAIRAGVIPYFAVQVVLVIGVFVIFSLLDYGFKKLQFSRGSFPRVHGFHHLFYFLIAFASPGEVSDEVPDIHTRNSTGW